MVNQATEQDIVTSVASKFSQVLRQMALEMQERVNSHDYNGHKLVFRIGINSGPVVAGVIGRQKFAYDLWGDAVNTTSRMESHGSGGHIQITRNTYDLIKDDFVCEPQGTVNVKGKGNMDVWYVTGMQCSKEIAGADMGDTGSSACDLPGI